MSLLTLTPISKRGKTLFTSIEPDELGQLRSGLREALCVPAGDVPPQPVQDWRSDWPRLTAFDLVGLHVPEAAGGLGTRADAAATAAAVLGEALHPAPYAGIVTAASVLARAGSAATGDLLSDMLAGTRVCGFAPYDEHSGTAATVCDPDASDALVLLDPRSGRAVLAPDPSCWTLAPSPQGAFDPTRTVTGIQVDLTRCVSLPRPELDPLPLYRLLLAADALGCLDRSVDRAVSYSAQRPAFGTVTGAFQAVQHRLVDHTVRVRGMRLAVSEAARMLTEDPDRAARAVLIAETAVSAHAVRILHDLVQLTGGIGFTWEHGLHLFERRAQADAHLAANPRRSRADLAAAEGWSA